MYQLALNIFSAEFERSTRGFFGGKMNVSLKITINGRTQNTSTSYEAISPIHFQQTLKFIINGPHQQVIVRLMDGFDLICQNTYLKTSFLMQQGRRQIPLFFSSKECGKIVIFSKYQTVISPEAQLFIKNVQKMPPKIDQLTQHVVTNLEKALELDQKTKQDMFVVSDQLLNRAQINEEVKEQFINLTEELSPPNEQQAKQTVQVPVQTIQDVGSKQIGDIADQLI